MLFGRISFTVLFPLFALGAAACGQDAHYTLTWRFANEAPAPFSARSCGQAGVESFQVIETELDGGTHKFGAICGAGSLERSLGPGTWTVSLQGVDPSGRVPAGALPMQMMLTGKSPPFVLSLDGPSPVVEVIVTPRPTCEDGIDNNGNGLVDSADSVCQPGGPGEVPGAQR